MGVVYLAEQKNLGRKVAIKPIRSDLLDSEAARVMRLPGDTLVVAGNELVVAPTAGGEPRRTKLPNPPSHLLELSPDADRIYLGKLGVDGLFDTACGRARLPGGTPRWFSGTMTPRGDRVVIGNRGSVRLCDLSGAASSTASPALPTATARSARGP